MPPESRKLPMVRVTSSTVTFWRSAGFGLGAKILRRTVSVKAIIEASKVYRGLGKPGKIRNRTAIPEKISNIRYSIQKFLPSDVRGSKRFRRDVLFDIVLFPYLGSLQRIVITLKQPKICTVNRYSLAAQRLALAASGRSVDKAWE